MGITRRQPVPEATSGAWDAFGHPNLLRLAVTLAGGSTIFKEALDNILERRMTMELSMTIALVAALAIGEVHRAVDGQCRPPATAEAELSGRCQSRLLLGAIADGCTGHLRVFRVVARAFLLLAVMVDCHARVIASPRVSSSTAASVTIVDPLRPHAPAAGSNILGFASMHCLC